MKRRVIYDWKRGGWLEVRPDMGRVWFFRNGGDGVGRRWRWRWAFEC